MSKRAIVTFGNQDKVMPYADALRRVGVEPVLVAPGMEESFAGVDGLVISGGVDVNAALYQQQPHPANDPPDDERDALERRLLDEALRRDLPVLAICRGMQLFNVVHGGTLHQHVEGHRHRGVDDAHTIAVQPGTCLADILTPGEHSVNSRHHQVVDVVGDGLAVSAKSPDGAVEALELEGRKFAVAVQWHPEDLLGKNPDSQRLFEAFAKAL
ncbi:MAG: gamma-glutamyl-gamma-aminobutyrate hydrolase family protein [Bryobacteraceae bacterium]